MRKENDEFTALSLIVPFTLVSLVLAVALVWWCKELDGVYGAVTQSELSEVRWRIFCLPRSDAISARL